VACIVVALGVVELADIRPDALEKPSPGTGSSALAMGVLLAPAMETPLLAGLLALTPRRWSVAPGRCRQA